MMRGWKRGRGGAVAAGVMLIAGAGLAGCGDAPQSFGDRAWVEVGPDGVAQARLITTAGSCPTIEVDGRVQAMSVRVEPAPPAFPVLVCEATLPPGAQRAEIDGVAMPLPAADPRRIAVIGDTGCRLETGDPPQACNDPSAWPFADLAQAVANWEPELIVHVGDYLYRENACPSGDAGCAGSPYGYNWEAIDADFFTPAEPLFREAPLALTRGNHESCDRAGSIWFRFLEPRPYDPTCVNYTEPYAIEAGPLQLLMFDSSNASDTSAEPEQVAVYREQFDRVRELAGPRAFFVTHRPVWAFGATDTDGMETLFIDNPTLQAGSENALPSSVEFVLSGHIHIFELLTFDPTPEFLRPPQFVVGNSGTSLSPAVTTPLAGLEIAGATVSLGETLHQFGWMTLERDGAGWLATLRDVAGRALLDCEVAEGAAACSS